MEKRMLLGLLAIFMIAGCFVSIAMGEDAEASGETDYTPTTVFIEGYAYEHVFIGWGTEPDNDSCLTGMEVTAEDGMLFISGTPMTVETVLLPFDAGGNTAYMTLSSVLEEEYEYGATPVKNGSTITFVAGETYDYQIPGHTLAGNSFVDGYSITQGGLTFTNGNRGGLPIIVVTGTAQSTATSFTLNTYNTNNVATSFTIEISAPILVTKITVSGEDHIRGPGGTISVVPVATPDNATNKRMTVSYYTGNASIATFDKTEVDSGESVTCTGVGYGEFRIAFRSTDVSGTDRVTGTWHAWVEKECFAKLSYNLNEGSGSFPTQTDSIWSEKNKIPSSNFDSNVGKASFIIPNSTPTKSNCYFTGWKLGTTTYQPGQTVKFSYDYDAGTVTNTLVAQWETLVLAQNVYTAQSSLTLTAGDSRTSMTTYAWTGVSSYGSTNTANNHHTTASVYSSSPSGAVSVSTSDSTNYTTLYITPLKEGTATVRVTAADGSGVYKDISVTVRGNVSVTYYPDDGTSYKLVTNHVKGSSFNLKTSADLVYYFEKTDVAVERLTSGGTEYQPGQSVTLNDDLELHIVWGQPQYTITFNTNGGNAIPSCTVTKGSTYQSAQGWPALDAVSKQNYTFTGWYKDSALTQPVNGSDTVDLTDNATFYAGWVENPKYTVTYYLSLTKPTVIGSEQVYKGQAISVYKDGISVTGYTYSGKWYDAQGFEVSKSAGINSDKDYYGQYTPISVTITFNTNGGSTVSACNVTYDARYSDSPGWPSNPTKSGSSFAGWYKDSEFTQPFDASNTVKITSGMTLYAKWSENAVDYVSVRYMSSLTDPDQIGSEQIVKGSTITFKTGIAMDGYTWNRWLYSNGSAYNVNTPVMSDLTLYGDYTKDTPPEPENPDPVNPDPAEPDPQTPENPETPVIDDARLVFQSERVSDKKTLLRFSVITSADHQSAVWTVDGQEVEETGDTLTMIMDEGVHDVSVKLVIGSTLSSPVSKTITVTSEATVTVGGKTSGSGNNTAILIAGLAVIGAVALAVFVIPRFRA